MKFDLKDMLEQAQKVQSEIGKIKEELANVTVEAESGGGMVKVKMTCANQLVGINIAPELFSENDKTMLEDLIVAAVNKAYTEAQEYSQEKFGKLGGMMPNIPGLNL